VTSQIILKFLLSYDLFLLLFLIVVLLCLFSSVYSRYFKLVPHYFKLSGLEISRKVKTLEDSSANTNNPEYLSPNNNSEFPLEYKKKISESSEDEEDISESEDTTSDSTTDNPVKKKYYQIKQKSNVDTKRFSYQSIKHALLAYASEGFFSRSTEKNNFKSNESDLKFKPRSKTKVIFVNVEDDFVVTPQELSNFYSSICVFFSIFFIIISFIYAVLYINFFGSMGPNSPIYVGVISG